MAQRKSMLEAFQASRAQMAEQPEPGSAPTPSEPRRRKARPPEAAPAVPAPAQGSASGGAFAAVLARLDRGPTIEAQVRALAAHQRLRWTLVGVMVVAAFLMGLAFGETREYVRAAELPADSGELGDETFDVADRDVREPAEEELAPAPNLAPASVASSFAAALFDRSNQYTVQAVTYGDDANDEALATVTVDYLTQQGFRAEACLKGEHIVVLVEAAPERADLAQPLARLKQIAGPPPGRRAREFQTAMIQKIDFFLPQR